MILDDIKAALETVDPCVSYGKAYTISDADIWNYTVFSRNRFSATGNDTGKAIVYEVFIIRENFIPEETIEATILAMENIAGMRLKGDEFPFDYMTKGKTGAIVEVLALYFVKPRKKARR